MIRESPGFSLVELLAVMAVGSVMVALLLASVRHGLDEGNRVQCLSKIRQLAQMAALYQNAHQGWFPPAYTNTMEEGRLVLQAWDFTTRYRDGVLRSEPGLLWQDEFDLRIQQCPVFSGKANWGTDPYTGYNYNTSYLGSPLGPAHVTEVGRPVETAVFGDGEWAGGANKFMRSPWGSPSDRGFVGRTAGTQGFRHAGATNTAFVDGHATSTHDCFYAIEGLGTIASGTGFLSPDNELYDLE